MKQAGFILANLLLTFTASAHGISDADKQGILEGGQLEYLKLGATHMLTGYDHLLFLFGVIFFLTKFRDIVKFITAFTLGHCLTLVFALMWSSVAKTSVMQCPSVKAVMNFTMSRNLVRKKMTPNKNSRWS